MSRVFGQVYADVYDTLYHDKDYLAECDVIEALFQQYGSRPITSILDLGCGTGNHAIPLTQRGYRVAGVDVSETMLAHAREKAALLDNVEGLQFHHGDIRQIDLKQTFDAALLMFAVLGYQIENNDVVQVLQAAQRHLQPGGLLIFDVWYGPAVLSIRPSHRISETEGAEGRILRVASGELNIYQHTCTVNYHIWKFSADRLVEETREAHTMRYFFPQELTYFASTCGFQLIQLGAFPDLKAPPGEDTWNVLAIARKTG